MTAVATEPAPSRTVGTPAAEAAPTVRPRPAPRTPALAGSVATAAVIGYSLAVALGFARVFSGWEFFRDLAKLVVVGHVLSFGLRRARVRGAISVPTLTAALVWLLLFTHYGATFRGGIIPTGATWDGIQLHVELFRDRFPTAVAPVEYGAEWAMLAGAAMVVSIVMTDAFAFLADARGEALVPGGVLFVFISALGDARLQVATTAVLIAAGVVTIVALRGLHDRGRRVELRSSRSRGSMVLPATLATAAVVAIAGAAIGTHLPGAGAEPLYETKGRSGGVTEVVSPLVDIRSRLTNQGESELFRVNADGEAYWRSTTLPEFDGSTFSLPKRSLERIDGSFGADADDGHRILQQIQVLGLRGLLIPAAAEPYQAEGESEGEQVVLKLNRDTSTLLADAELDTGDVFTVVSSAPALSPDQLRAATSDHPPDEIFVSLPDGFPGKVAEITADVTAGATTPFDRAIALQNWFRTEFEYSTEVQSGHGTSAILSFLDERIGYCEQFSASFAAMARTIGIPSRVAVGFTPGVRGDDGWYSVRGRNAHAWPELWFDDIGWVAFEPTPGRGAPGNEGYTGVAAQQDTTPATGGGGGGGDATATVPPTAPETIVPPPTTALGADEVPDGGDATPGRPRGPLPDEGMPAPFDTTGSTSSQDGIPGWVWAAAVGLLALAAAGPALVRRWRARRARSHNSTERVQAAWARARTAVTRAGIHGTGSMTSHEWVAATADDLPVAARPMRSLADVVDRVSFAPPGAVDLDRPGSVGATLGHDCELWSNQVDRLASDTMTPWQRVRHYFADWR